MLVLSVFGTQCCDSVLPFTSRVSALTFITVYCFGYCINLMSILFLFFAVLRHVVCWVLNCVIAEHFTVMLTFPLKLSFQYFWTSAVPCVAELCKKRKWHFRAYSKVGVLQLLIVQVVLSFILVTCLHIRFTWCTEIDSRVTDIYCQFNVMLHKVYFFVQFSMR